MGLKQHASSKEPLKFPADMIHCQIEKPQTANKKEKPGQPRKVNHKGRTATRRNGQPKKVNQHEAKPKQVKMITGRTGCQHFLSASDRHCVLRQGKTKMQYAGNESRCDSIVPHPQERHQRVAAV
jgi:hypothetical protein